MNAIIRIQITVERSKAVIYPDGDLSSALATILRQKRFSLNQILTFKAHGFPIIISHVQAHDKANSLLVRIQSDLPKGIIEA